MAAAYQTKSGATSVHHGDYSQYADTRISFDSIWDRDERELAKLGKKSVLRVSKAHEHWIGLRC